MFEWPCLLLLDFFTFLGFSLAWVFFFCLGGLFYPGFVRLGDLVYPRFFSGPFFSVLLPSKASLGYFCLRLFLYGYGSPCRAPLVYSCLRVRASSSSYIPIKSYMLGEIPIFSYIELKFPIIPIKSGNVTKYSKCLILTHSSWLFREIFHPILELRNYVYWLRINIIYI